MLMLKRGSNMSKRTLKCRVGRPVKVGNYIAFVKNKEGLKANADLSQNLNRKTPATVYSVRP